jgi:hypothetical protein
MLSSSAEIDYRGSGSNNNSSSFAYYLGGLSLLKGAGTAPRRLFDHRAPSFRLPNFDTPNQSQPRSNFLAPNHLR